MFLEKACIDVLESEQRMSPSPALPEFPRVESSVFNLNQLQYDLSHLILLSTREILIEFLWAQYTNSVVLWMTSEWISWLGFQFWNTTLFRCCQMVHTPKAKIMFQGICILSEFVLALQLISNQFWRFRLKKFALLLALRFFQRFKAKVQSPKRCWIVSGAWWYIGQEVFTMIPLAVRQTRVAMLLWKHIQMKNWTLGRTFNFQIQLPLKYWWGSGCYIDRR